MKPEILGHSLADRADLVDRLLHPDEIHNHRVSRGLQLTGEQTTELLAAARLIGGFDKGMAAISQEALDAPMGDTLMRTVRMLLGTEALHQAQHKGEIGRQVLPTPQLTKSDLILTSDGFRVVEIEPGKVRGLGYARMARAQARRPLGTGAEMTLAAIAGGRPVAVVLSETDKFHLPEMRLLARFATGLRVVQQDSLRLDEESGKVSADALLIGQAIMMSPLHKGRQVSEGQLRGAVRIVSDRRLDLESKGALALLHNTDGLPDLESLLLQHFTPESLAALRQIVPVSMHTSLLSPERQRELSDTVAAGHFPAFLKPLAAAGTRGIVTPDQPQEASRILGSKKLARTVVVQQAHEGIRPVMESLDVRTRSEHSDEVSLRITLHTDVAGAVVDASVVGSPHRHLAHGGKTSIITNIEVPEHV